MTFSPTIISPKEQRSFKKRKNNNFKNFRLNFGTKGLLILKKSLIEPIYLKFLKKTIKKTLQKTSAFSICYPIKIWFCISFNFPITKKSKNARMGKGKGSFHRWIIYLTAGTIFLETINLSFYRLKQFILILRIFTPFKFTILTLITQSSFIYFSSNKTYSWFF